MTSIDKINSLTSGIFLIILISLVQVSSYSDELKVEKESDGGLIGDIVPVSVTVSVPKGSAIDWPNLQDTSGKLEVIEISKIDTLDSDDENQGIYSREYAISAYDSVNAYVPDIVLSYTRPGMDEPNFLTAPGFTLSFSTVAVDTTQPIKDIKGIKEVDYTDYTIWWILGGLLIAAIIVYILWRKHKNKPVIERERIVPAESPRNWALRRLSKIEQDAVWKDNKFKEHHTAISDTIKGYIEKQFRTNATDMTTSELSRWLDRPDINSEAKVELIRWLQLGDMIKFAKYVPVPEENTAPITASKVFVEKTSQALPVPGDALAGLDNENKEKGERI